MIGLIALGGAALAVLGLARWARRRWDNVDSYYEREYQDPPVLGGNWFGGGGSSF